MHRLLFYPTLAILPRGTLCAAASTELTDRTSMTDREQYETNYLPSPKWTGYLRWF
jgi:hypothetical protein